MSPADKGIAAARRDAENRRSYGASYELSKREIAALARVWRDCAVELNMAPEIDEDALLTKLENALAITIHSL